MAYSSGSGSSNVYNPNQFYNPDQFYNTSQPLSTGDTYTAEPVSQPERNHFYIAYKTRVSNAGASDQGIHVMQFSTSVDMTKEAIIECLNRRPVPGQVPGRRTHASKASRNDDRLVVKQDSFDLAQVRGIVTIAFISRNTDSDDYIESYWTYANGQPRKFHHRTNNCQTSAVAAFHARYGDNFQNPLNNFQARAIRENIRVIFS